MDEDHHIRCQDCMTLLKFGKCPDCSAVAEMPDRPSVLDRDALDNYLTWAVFNYKAIRQALQSNVADGWRDISSAPRDGTAVLGYFPSRRGYAARQDVMTIHYVGNHDWQNTCSGHTCAGRPTDWQPLPEPPNNVDYS